MSIEMVLRYNIALQGAGPVLAGAPNGKAAFASLVRELSHEPADPTPLFLDFQHVDVATASYLRESIFALKNYLRTISSKIYPVAANANEDVEDELWLVANARNDAIICCNLNQNDHVSEIRLIGQLDPKQQLTFDLVHRMKRADAAVLMKRFGEAEQTKSTTAWNNRLSGLAARGLIREFSNGRAKHYRPVLEASD